jgi:cytochrome c oxidase subunit 2
MANGSGTGRITAPGVALGALLLVLILAGVWLFMTDTYWFAPLASEHGAAVDRVFVAVLIATGIAFVIVQGLLAWFVARYGENGEDRASYWHDNPKGEVILIGITAVTLTVLVFMGQSVWASIYFADPPEDALTIEVTGQQFQWVFRYPGPDGEFGTSFDPEQIDNFINFIGLDRNDPAGADDILAGAMHVVVGEPVRTVIRSTDVIHSFHVPHMRIKQDAVPGLGIEIWFTPTVAGTYEIACAELCGLNHFVMKGTLVVHEDQAGLDAFLEEQALSQ